MTMRIELNTLNEELRHRERELPGRDEIRTLLGEYGSFVRIGRLAEGEISALTGGRGLAACDGSRVEYGSFFPYYVVLERAVAICGGHELEVREEGCYSPLQTGVMEDISSLAAGANLGASEVFSRYARMHLAARELSVACEAARCFAPWCLLLDGGFLLFDGLPRWGELNARCEECGTLLIGVIEEVGTSELARRLWGRPLGDADLLFGLLDEGEAYIVDPDKPIKKDYQTAFVRFSNFPGITACDFSGGCRGEMLTAALKLLYSVTNRAGRGVPLPLDIVDRKVRITRGEGEILLKSSLDGDLYERYFKAQRGRRYL